MGQVSVVVLIIVIVILLGLAALAFVLGIQYRKKVGEAQIGSAETKAREIIDDALKSAESKKREILLEAGFTETADNPQLDLTDLKKDTLLALFS